MRAFISGIFVWAGVTTLIWAVQVAAENGPGWFSSILTIISLAIFVAAFAEWPTEPRDPREAE